MGSDKSEMNVQNYRREGRNVLLSSGKISQSDVKRLEQQAWDHSYTKYPIVIRRLYTGMSIFEAVAELEPITKMQRKENSPNREANQKRGRIGNRILLLFGLRETMEILKTICILCTWGSFKHIRYFFTHPSHP